MTQQPFSSQDPWAGSTDGFSAPSNASTPHGVPPLPPQPGVYDPYHQAPPQPNYYGQVPAAPTYQKSKMAAGLLGIFLGGLGVHNFYLGFTGKAVAQLLISLISLGFLAFVSAIWGLIEGILILSAQPGTQWSFDAAGYPLTQ